MRVLQERTNARQAYLFFHAVLSVYRYGIRAARYQKAPSVEMFMLPFC